MCLVHFGGEHPEFKKTKEETVFYKVLMYLPQKGGYFTPVQHHPTELNTDLEIPSWMEWDVREIGHNYEMEISPWEKVWAVDGGGFHLYVRKSDADSDITAGVFDNQMYHGIPVVFKAVVPPDTEYIEGYFGGDDSVAVTRVRYEEI